MKGVNLSAVPSRIRGRISLLRRLRCLLIAAHRYGRHRAATPDDLVFSAHLIDGLTSTLQTVDPGAPKTEARP